LNKHNTTLRPAITTTQQTSATQWRQRLGEAIYASPMRVQFSYLLALLAITIIGFVGYGVFMFIATYGLDAVEMPGVVRERFNSLTYLASILLATVLGTLVFIYWRVFRPMARRIGENERLLRVEIEERTATEVRLRQSETLYRLLVEHLPHSAVLLFDHELRYTLVEGGALNLLGYPRQQLMGRTVHEAFLATRAAELEPHYRKALAGEATTTEGDIEGVRCRTQYLPLWDDGGLIIGGLVLAQDITEEKRAADSQMALALERERVKLLNEFVRDISHDFRTPLAILSTSLYLLKRLQDPDKNERRVETMERQIDRIAKLLDQLVLMSALEIGINFQVQSLYLPSMLKTLRDRFATQSAAAGVEMVLLEPSEVPNIEADAVHLTRALSNLVENALHYTAEGGRVTLGVDWLPEQSGVTITISDTGTGIDPNDLPYIFDRFYRTDKSRNADTGGAGLGLTMVKKIIERHQGTVSIDSTFGEGTTVRVQLPVTQGQRRAHEMIGIT
jgi:PAS domain S-box-containing protein